MGDTYKIKRRGDHVSIECLRCGCVSYNPNDVNNRYCGKCHVFHDTGKGYRTVDNVNFNMFSLCKAPTCGACNTWMVPADRLNWKCPDQDCRYFDKPIHTGSYPIDLTRG